MRFTFNTLICPYFYHDHPLQSAVTLMIIAISGLVSVNVQQIHAICSFTAKRVAAFAKIMVRISRSINMLFHCKSYPLWEGIATSIVQGEDVMQMDCVIWFEIYFLW